MIWDGSAGTVSYSQINFVDSNEGVILADASELEAALGKSKLIDDIDKIDLLLDGEIVQTIQANELTDSPLGLTFSDTIGGLDVSLGAANKITTQVAFTETSNYFSNDNINDLKYF
ncbi:MAG TPA: hypothetical protein ACFCUY_08950 [Xenococcaceae cyanobacterium]|jgi:hypothetical protein